MSKSNLKICCTVFLVVCVCLTTSFLSAQNNTAFDAQLFQKSLQGQSLYQLTRALYQAKDKNVEKASVIAQHIENEFLTSGNPKEKAGAAITLSVWERKKGNSEQSLALLDHGISIAETIENDSILYLASLRKGTIHYYQTNHKPALDAYYKALEIAKKNNSEKREIIVTDNIALVRMQAKDTQAAIDLLLQNLRKIQEKPSLINDNSKLSLYVNLCGAYIYMEEYNAAEIYCKEGEKLNETLQNTLSEAHILSAYAEIARNNKYFEKSHRFLDEAEKLMNERFGKENLHLFLKFYRAKTFYDQGKFENAVTALQEIEVMKNDYAVEILSIQEMYYFMAKSYKELGQAEEAIAYYEKAEQIDNKNDKIRDELNTNLVKKFDLVQLKDEITELQQQSAKTITYYSVGILLLVVIIIGLLTFTKIQQRKNKQRFAALIQQLEEKRETKKRYEAAKIDSKQQSEAKVNSNEKSVEKPEKMDPIMAEILQKLDEFEAKELFLSQDTTLVEVAKKIQTNTTYLSKVINTHKEKSFTSYITDLRVDYAIERLSHDRKFRSFTIGAIAQEIGFKRSESFSKAFKVKTGLYPSYFIKELEKQKDTTS